jgi:hypothetical protein
VLADVVAGPEVEVGLHRLPVTVANRQVTSRIASAARASMASLDPVISTSAASPGVERDDLGPPRQTMIDVTNAEDEPAA